MDRAQFKILYRPFLFAGADLQTLSAHTAGDSDNVADDSIHRRPELTQAPSPERSFSQLAVEHGTAVSREIATLIGA